MDERTTESGACGPDRLIGPPRVQPTAVDVNATMSRLGIDVEWSDEAVGQLTAAAAALDAYLETHPDQAQAVLDSPESALQALVDQGLLATPVGELRSAMAATREHQAAVLDG